VFGRQLLEQAINPFPYIPYITPKHLDSPFSELASANSVSVWLPV
jgi:hypothetical protein